jgi:hypothetical protein
MQTSVVICLLLVSAALAAPLPDYCGRDEPLPIPPLNRADMQLTNVQTIIRHGDRLPLGRCWSGSGPWSCSLNIQSREGYAAESVTRLYPKKYIMGRNIQPGTCAAGQLTEKGYKQHLANGRMFRKYFVDTMAFMPANLTLSSFYVHSDDVPRVVASAETLLVGMYPPQMRNGQIEVVDINTEDLTMQNMYGNYITCPRLKVEEQIFDQSPQFIAHYNQVTLPIAQQFGQIFNTNYTNINLGDLFDCLSTHICHGLPLPQGVTMDLYYRLKNDLTYNYYAQYNYSNIVTLNIGFLLDEMYTALQKIVGGASVTPFLLYSGHDATIMPVIAALGLSDGMWTPYASHFIIESYKQQGTGAYFHRFLYNSKVLTLPGCSSLCPSDFVLNLFQSVSITDPSICSVSNTRASAWMGAQHHAPSFIEYIL